MAEFSTSDLQTFDLKTSYTWGLDLSGSFQGAGGVGGLLAVTRHQTQNTSHYFPTFDGNGNISEYLTASGSIAAHYEYDPFGRIIVETGTNAADFQYRFSTKPVDSATGLYYYGYRGYDPETGRWINRDPIEENGGINLYVFVRNDAAKSFDVLGLDDVELLFRTMFGVLEGAWDDIFHRPPPPVPVINCRYTGLSDVLLVQDLVMTIVLSNKENLALPTVPKRISCYCERICCKDGVEQKKFEHVWSTKPFLDDSKVVVDGLFDFYKDRFTKGSAEEPFFAVISDLVEKRFTKRKITGIINEIVKKEVDAMITLRRLECAKKCIELK